ncbi:YppE family protein [Cytobacillus depressus]|uniref:YppE family protein n=1 Tax=Cytobacillus depressus TaxID=1602942 RepID=A0A6L3VF75_9BACI|nr:YppE family protein [Cytobacillus depressus]KAB2338284.1 YppE family protein [Cytobacillus depressus]
MGNIELSTLTKELINYINVITERFAEAKETGVAGDFFLEVKPFADEVKGVNDQWKKEAGKWVIQNKPKNLYSQQIDSVHEHIETISVQAFFPQTSRARFNHLVVSSNYVLNYLLQILLEEMGPPTT